MDYAIKGMTNMAGSGSNGGRGLGIQSHTGLGEYGLPTKNSMMQCGFQALLFEPNKKRVRMNSCKSREVDQDRLD